MNKRTVFSISGIALFLLTNLISSQTIVNAQVTSKDDSTYLSGSIDNDKLSGFFSKGKNELNHKNQFIFIGENGKVYRLTLIDKNIGELYIDGQRIEDSQIWKHTAEYKPFLLKFWRNQEIEREVDEVEAKLKPLDQKINNLEKEIDKLDEEIEKIEEKLEKGATGFTDNRKSIKEKIKLLKQEVNEIESQTEEFEKLQDKLDDESEAIDLHQETEKVLQQIIKDLVSLGAVKATANLSFKLSNVELIINGKKASPEIYNLLKNRYIFDATSETGFLYLWKGKI